jgi:CMP-N-acetylneuraminic acid synthetase
MKTIIPAKKSSSRVPDKNWRPFHENKCLVEIKIEQLLKSTAPSDIYLSCDDNSKKNIADKYGINFLLRNTQYASDDTPWPDALHGIINETSFDNNEAIAWVEVINPLFSDYALLYRIWNEKKAGHDSLVLASPVKKFLLDKMGRPINFQFGKWHSMSQQMEALYAWDSACIMSKKNLLYFSYPIGKTPYIVSTGSQCIDIDTMEDFELAQYYYNKKLQNENQ